MFVILVCSKNCLVRDTNGEKQSFEKTIEFVKEVWKGLCKFSLGVVVAS